MENYGALGWALAQSPTSRDGDLTRFQAEAAEAVKFAPGVWITVSVPDGRIVLSTFAPVGEAHLIHGAPEVVRQGFSTGKAQVADLTLGTRLVRPVIDHPSSTSKTDPSFGRSTVE